jgi:hypothetical protein
MARDPIHIASLPSNACASRIAIAGTIASNADQSELAHVHTKMLCGAASETSNGFVGK